VLLRILYRGIYEKTSVATAAKGAESRQTLDFDVGLLAMGVFFGIPRY